jgi:hypothetical protein
MGPGVGKRARDVGLVGAVLVGAVLRFWGFAAQSFWYDEWLTGEAAAGDLTNLERYVTEQAGIPPTYFGFIWNWARVFGDSDAALRLPSVLVGIGLIVVAYLVAIELGLGRTAARLAAVLVAVNPMLVWYSQEARPYSILAFLGLLSVWAILRARESSARRELAIWTFLAACTIAVHYIGVFLVAAEVTVLLLTSRRRPAWRDLAVAAVPGLVVLGLLAPFAAQQFSRRANHSWIIEFPLSERLGDTVHSVLVGPSVPEGRMWIVVGIVMLIGVALLGLGLVHRADSNTADAADTVDTADGGGTNDDTADGCWNAWLIGGLGAGAFVLSMVGAVVGLDMIVSRYLVVTLVPMLIAVATGLGSSRAPRWLGPVAVGVVSVLSIVAVASVARDPALQRAGWESVADAHQKESGRQGSRLLVMNLHGFLGQPLFRYLDGEQILWPGETAQVDQIDVIVTKPTDEPCNLFVGLACSLIFLGAPLPGAPAASFRLDERIELDQFVVERYRSDQPVTLAAADVVPPAELADSLVVVTPPAGRG